MFASVVVDAFRFIGNNASFLLSEAGQTAELAFASLGIAILIALPVGLWLGHRHRGLFIALALSSLGRALPSIALIGFFITILGVSFWNLTIALVVLGVPPILTNSYFAVEGVDRDAVEAARGMGLTEAQILVGVELPLGLPLIIAGIVGGGGLGDIISNQQSFGLAGVFGASLVISAMALLTAAVLGLAQRAAYRRMSPSA